MAEKLGQRASREMVADRILIFISSYHIEKGH
jgi:hypothetical protein